jgi:NAD(P)-dependent dehydrogenase (short-subunit alcohol dehydrogenase family)
MARRWALILGVSSGLGAASARALAAAGYDILGLHLDRRATMPAVEALVAELMAMGRQVRFWNENAADDERRATIVEAIAGEVGDSGVSVFLHSLAFGTLKPLVAPSPGGGISRRQLEMTQDVMANSLIYWVGALVDRGLLQAGGRVFAFTSEGSHRAATGYGAVGAAKAALEAYIRQLAFELAPRQITANAIQAGVTDTPALRKIPGHEQIIEATLRRNPHGRLTCPEDVAAALVELARPGTHWMTGNVICVDGGEDVSG